MQPIGPLMIEHRLIEKMIALIEKETKKIEQENRVNPLFIETAVDFIRTYADRCHHGKEEDILFRDLEKLDLKPEHKKTMDELVDEHIRARNAVARLVEEKDNYVRGDRNAVPKIVKEMKWLAGFYPQHIEKEDKDFFIPVMDYFTDSEKDDMLKEFYDFDQTLIHEKYRKVVEEIELQSE